MFLDRTDERVLNDLFAAAGGDWFKVVRKAEELAHAQNVKGVAADAVAQALREESRRADARAPAEAAPSD